MFNYLEFRHIDDRLDDRLEAAYRLIRPDRRRRVGLQGLWKTHGDAVRQVRGLEIEAASLFERVDNALKLIGDHYLSRVFDLTSTDDSTCAAGSNRFAASWRPWATFTTCWSSRPAVIAWKPWRSPW